MAKAKKAAPAPAVSPPWHRLAQAIVISNAGAVGLLAVRIMASGSYRYWFLVWNLFLAWLPVFFAWTMRRNLKYKPLPHWSNLVLLAFWLGFLPNSFYIISDYIHLHATYEVSLLYDVVLFGIFTWNGLLAGFIALYMVHESLLERLTARWAHGLTGLVLLLSSFAIYMGRYLRWNTWDVFVDPAGLWLDVSDRLINPGSYPRTFTTTITFFILLGSIYLVVWQLVRYLKAVKQP